MGEKFHSFNQQTWPLPEQDSNADQDSVEWKLRYSPQSLTRADHVYAAAVMSAYRTLIAKSQRERAVVVSNLREALADRGTE